MPKTYLTPMGPWGILTSLLIFKSCMSSKDLEKLKITVCWAEETPEAAGIWGQGRAAADLARLEDCGAPGKAGKAGRREGGKSKGKESRRWCSETDSTERAPGSLKAERNQGLSWLIRKCGYGLTFNIWKNVLQYLLEFVNSIDIKYLSDVLPL